MASEALRYQVQLGDYGTLDKKLIDVQILLIVSFKRVMRGPKMKLRPLE